MKRKHIVIVGGGASGLMAAISAGREGADVTLIEQKDQLGKKILSTGNGKCNLTNEYMKEHCFRGDDTSIVTDVLNQFGHLETIDYFNQLGLLVKNKQGYIYPLSEQASTIVDILCAEVKHLGINVLLGQRVTGLSKTTKGYITRTNKCTLESDAVILATGGKAAPVLGSDGSGYELAKQFGHKLSAVVPALVQLKGKSTLFKQIAGVRCNAKVTLFVNQEEVCCEKGELQLTNYGISGIPVFQVSRHAAKGIEEKKRVMTEIDFLPTMTDEEFYSLLKERITRLGNRSCKDFFVGIFHQKLISLFIKITRISHIQNASEITGEQLQLFIKVTKHFIVDIEGTNDFNQAQVCAGGVRTTEINSKTMESLYADGLYFTGELLDIDGICGGYNLQWAWSTGYIAGKNAAKGK